MNDDDPQITRWFELASQQIARGDIRGAIESLRGILGLDPDSGEAHALLSICLVHSKRLHAAEVEARLALVADPNGDSANWAMGVVLAASRRFKEAEPHYRLLTLHG